MLCKACTRYPRHYEEYENLREISLSLSCPAAARMIMSSDERMTFLKESRETPKEKYESFDSDLFRRLQKIREYLYWVAQNRELSIEERMALLAATSHDLQNRIGRRRFYPVEDLLKRYETPAFLKTARKKFAKYQGKKTERRTQLQKMWRRLYRLEVLRPSWTELLKEQEQMLYCKVSEEEYREAVCAFTENYKEKEYEYEQLLMYFLFTYVCGAVYDRDLFSKVRLAVVNTMLIRELGIAVWLSRDRQLSFEDQVELAHRYAREVEHSESNIKAMEYMTAEEELFTLEKLLNGILG